MTNQVCRTCLQVIPNESELFPIEENQATTQVQIIAKLEACVPEIAINRVKNSVICIKCLGALNTAYNFKTQCIETETKICKYMSQKAKDFIDLNSFLYETLTENNGNDNDILILNSYQIEEAPIPSYILPNNSIKCLVCQKCFNSTEEIKEHINSHIDENLKCTICEFRSKSKQTMNEHLKTHNNFKAVSNDLTFVCSDCDYKTSDRFLFIEHRTLHTGEKLHSCHLCSFKSTHSSSVRRHLKVHAGQKAFKCSVCGYRADDIAALQLHSKTHTGERPYVCPECPYTGIKRSNLRKHILRNHPGKMPAVIKPVFTEKVSALSAINGVADDVLHHRITSDGVNPYQLSMDEIRNILEDKNVDDIINKPELDEALLDVDSFTISVTEIEGILKGNGVKGTTKNDLKNSKTEIFRCPKCRLPFKYKYLLRRHMSTHSGDNKPLQCNDCGFSDTRKSYFDLHMKMHTGGKIYSCEKCDFRTIYWTNMQKHNRAHNGQKPLKCSYCNYKTSLEANFNKHMLTHVESEPDLEQSFQCSECPYETTIESEIEAHLEMHAISNEFIDNSIHILPHDFD